ncbi:hypothetical protein A3K78_05590 [Candidatus Bathyarchaeota archaeon RBG_13_52_12]|nr:MAG: hypothetical protein A3K78_05590 [Candidatus Bathyarchaeota archaeon RBG_13_52_12]
MNKRRVYLLALTAIITLSLLIVWRNPCLINNNGTIVIYTNYRGYQSLYDMTHSVEAIIVGRVDAIQSRTWSVAPFTTFNITVFQAVKPSTLNQSKILVNQGGYKDECRTAIVSGDPLMNVGETYIFFLDKSRIENRTSRNEYVPDMGGLSMFPVRSEKVYPRYESWTPSVSGMTVENLVKRLETYLSHPPFPQPLGPSVEYTYGLKANLTSTAGQWSSERGVPLLQPTWSPDGFTQTAVYVRNSNATTNTSVITQVTTLYSSEGIDDPTTAEIQLRVQREGDMYWMVPHPGVKIGVEGNYTVIAGHSGYAGVIGWFDGGYYELYGGSARVVSVLVGDVLFFFRAPESVSYSDLIKMASSLKPV